MYIHSATHSVIGGWRGRGFWGGTGGGRPEFRDFRVFAGCPKPTLFIWICDNWLASGAVWRVPGLLGLPGPVFRGPVPRARELRAR